jgi:ABC-type histidine transport system ATPase subunit
MNDKQYQEMLHNWEEELFDIENQIKTNAEMLRLMQDEALKAAKNILSNLGVDTKHPKFSQLQYQLQFDIYQSLKKTLEIESDY